MPRLDKGKLQRAGIFGCGIGTCGTCQEVAIRIFITWLITLCSDLIDVFAFYYKLINSYNLQHNTTFTVKLPQKRCSLWVRRLVCICESSINEHTKIGIPNTLDFFSGAWYRRRKKDSVSLLITFLQPFRALLWGTPAWGRDARVFWMCSLMSQKMHFLWRYFMKYWNKYVYNTSNV